MNLDFYRAFEERYRGSQEQIRLRLRVYLPFIKPLIGLYGDAKAVDLGCGRGEWLELLKEEGFDARGVDLDEGMLVACKELGLNVQVGDAVGFLKELPEASQVIVSGFHLVEHIPFVDVQALVQEALRVLKPGGLLILETPNPENIVVGSSSFYLDPTHQRPIPPQLLAFLPDYYGYEKTKIVRLQESLELHSTKPPRLLDVLNGASPDYSIVARKKGNAKILAATKKAFSKEYGLTLDNLAIRYDLEVESKMYKAEAIVYEVEVKANQAEAKAYEVEVKANQAEAKAYEVEVKANQAEAKANQAEAKAYEVEVKANQAEAKANQAEAKAYEVEVKANQIELELKIKTTQLESTLLAISKSTSWKITEPLRMVGRVTKKILSLIKASNLRHQENRNLLFAHIKLYINRRNALRRIVLRLLTSFSVMDVYIKQKGRIVENGEQISQLVDVELTSLSPRVRRIYSNLKVASQNPNRGDF
jgi:O-antigen chain-terminating methyltransferase